MKKIGIIILIIGLGLLLITVVTVVTKEKVVEIGPLEVKADKPHHLNWSPFIGIGVMVIGGMVVWISNKNIE